MSLKEKVIFITGASSGIGAAAVHSAAVHSIDFDVRNRHAVQSGDEGRAANVYKEIAPLIGADIADVIVWAVTRPAHGKIARVALTSVNQANTLLIHREA